MAQVDTLAELRAYGARSAMHGAAADPTWGLLGARLRYRELRRALQGLKRAGVPAITWVEGFGDCTTYAAALAIDPSGRLVRDPADPTLPRVLLNHWGWQALPSIGPHRTVWMGPEAYFDDAPWARPYTRTHPRYGAAIPRYPDGRPALGFIGDGSPKQPTAGPADPSRARIFDAGGAKDLNGRLRPEWSVNVAASARIAAPGSAFARAGSVPVVVGRDDIADAPNVPVGTVLYATHASIHKDAACPFWIDYAAASYRQIFDLGLDGLWCDNFSAWDNFGYPPLQKAFGDWSVARFRREAVRDGLARPGARYDVRVDLKARFRRYFPGRDPDRLDDPEWRSVVWLDDPAWRAYRTFKRRVGAEALRGLWSCVYREARARRRPDLLLTGNDIPLFALGWVRPEYLGMVNTELSPGWHMGTGSFGTGLLPEGRLSPIYRLMTEHGRAPYAVAWLYLEGEYAPYRTKPGAFRAVAAEAMLGRAILLGYDSSGRTAGTPPEHHEWNRFVARASPLWRGRRPAAEAAVLWSPSSQLAYMAPDGYPDMDAQPHAFGYYGWATYLEEAHIPYRALPEFAVTPAALKPLRLLVLAGAECMSDRLAGMIRGWVRRGGTLVVAGANGTRYGEDRADLRRPKGLFQDWQPAAGGDAPVRTRHGHGWVVGVRNDPGLDYYIHRQDRARLAPRLARCLAGYIPSMRVQAPATVGLSVYRAPDGAIQIDLADLDLDRGRDTIRPARDLILSFPVPGAWGRHALSARALPFLGSPRSLAVQVENGRAVIRLPSLGSFETLRVGP